MLGAVLMKRGNDGKDRILGKEDAKSKEPMDLEGMLQNLAEQIPDGFELHAIKKDGKLTFNRCGSFVETSVMLFAYQFYSVIHGSADEREKFFEMVKAYSARRESGKQYPEE